MNNSDIRTDQLEEFLYLLGLNTEEKQVYIALLSGADQTVLQIARKSGVNRTTAYRILEQLKKQKLAEEIIESNRIKFRRTSSDKLQLLIKTRQIQVDQLSKLLPHVTSIINHVSATGQPGTKVLFYRGREGIRQMAWNNLKCHDPIVGYTYRPYVEIIGEKFLNQWYQEWSAKRMVCRDIYSDAYLRALPKFLQQESLLSNSKYFVSRYIPSGILDITHQIDIYDDCLAIYNWYEGETFGVEIHNEKVARLQKQIFELVWKQASPVPAPKPHSPSRSKH